jgi:hypothetical protein
MRTALAPAVLLALLATGCLSADAYADPPQPPPWWQALPAQAAETAPIVVAGPTLEVVDDAERPLPTFAQGGRRFVLGDLGERYRLRIVNPTAGRLEAVVSVDGLDAIDGKPANVGKRGYIVPAYGDVTIDGWRTSLDSVAAFRFSSVRESYAARTRHPRNVGVIGVAFFRERPVAPPPEPSIAGRAQGRPAGVPLPSARTAPAPAAPPAEAPVDSAEQSASGAAAPRSRAATKSDERPGLGTEFGEEHDSRVSEVPFYRAAARPDAVSEVRYDDAEGLEARGIAVRPWRVARDEENARRDQAQPFPEARFAAPPR